jgi:membrane-associated PAP2 superfamily phosphatase
MLFPPKSQTDVHTDLKLATFLEHSLWRVLPVWNMDLAVISLTLLSDGGHEIGNQKGIDF